LIAARHLLIQADDLGRQIIFRRRFLYWANMPMIAVARGCAAFSATRPNSRLMLVSLIMARYWRRSQFAATAAD
jgi:hypothetical protein